MKKIIPKFFGKKMSGRLVLDRPEEYRDYLNLFPEDSEIEITVAKRYQRRTSGKPGEDTNFNGYYHGVILKMVGNEIGEMDRRKVHDWIQLETGNTSMMPNGTFIPAGTSHLSGGEFSEFCSKARIWASQFLNITIPEPHEVLENYDN